MLDQFTIKSGPVQNFMNKCKFYARSDFENFVLNEYIRILTLKALLRVKERDKTLWFNNVLTICSESISIFGPTREF